MRQLKGLFGRLGRDQRGATAIEYALLGSLIAMAIVIAVGSVGQALAALFSDPVLLDALG